MMERQFFKYKHERVKHWIENRGSPFDVETVAKACEVSKGYAQDTVNRYFTGKLYCYWRPDGHGNFRVVYFPHDWTEEMRYDYLHSKVKSGKSKAKVGRL